MSASDVPTIRIADTDVQVVEYKGERVVTFKQIDAVHGRPDGTAKRNFNENRERFVEDVDFLKVCADEIRTHKIMPLSSRAHEDITFLTRRGYFLLCKSLNDDRAWAIHGEMVEAYFAVIDGAPVKAKAVSREVSPTELRRQHSYWLSIAERAIPDANAALFSANRMTRKATGVDIFEEMGVNLLPSPEPEVALPPTAYCEALGIGRGEINPLLVKHGFQTAHRDHKDRLYYVLTPKGIEAGGRGLDRTIEHDAGTTMKVEIKWPRSIVERLQAEPEPDGNVLPFPA